MSPLQPVGGGSTGDGRCSWGIGGAGRAGNGCRENMPTDASSSGGAIAASAHKVFARYSSRTPFHRLLRGVLSSSSFSRNQQPDRQSTSGRRQGTGTLECLISPDTCKGTVQRVGCCSVARICTTHCCVHVLDNRTGRFNGKTFRADEQIPDRGYGEDHDLRYLVMTRLGPDILAAKTNSEPWPVSRTAGYAQQMLHILRALHERCRMVFVDVKPGERQMWRRL